MSTVNCLRSGLAQSALKRASSQFESVRGYNSSQFPGVATTLLRTIPAVQAPAVAETIETPSIPQIIGSVNGKQWLSRWEAVNKLISPLVIAQNLNSRLDAAGTDLKGQGVYSKEDGCQEETRYDIVNSWQVNYPRGFCNLQGQLLETAGTCYDDEALFRDFHAERPSSVVLDVGCNSGKNLSRALHYGGPGTQVFGIEYSPESVAIAQAVHGKDHAFQGDATSNFVDIHAWEGKFSVVQCTAVLQHMTPKQVQAALANIARCLKPGGELLLTFKDAPTQAQMEAYGMEAWIDEIFTADIVSKTNYIRDGYLQAVMWDDDYYAGVTSSQPPLDRNTKMPGLHRREFVFYGLEWMKSEALKHGLVAEHVEVMPDSKIPRSALHWMVVFRSEPLVPSVSELSSALAEH